MKKLLIFIVIVVTILCVLFGINYYVYKLPFIDKVFSLFIDDIDFNHSTYTFKGKEIKGKVKQTEEYDTTVDTRTLVYNDCLVSLPVNVTNITDMYSDCVYDNDGSFIAMLSEDPTNYIPTDTEVITSNVGAGNPVVLQVRFSNSKYVLYIKCYDDNSLSFYSSIDYNSIISTSEVLRSLENSELGFSIPEEIMNDFTYDTGIINALSGISKGSDGVFEFIEKDGYTIRYKRVMDYYRDRINKEYIRMTEMGYSPISYGIIDDVHILNFEDVTVLTKPITTNTCMVYYVN